MGVQLKLAAVKNPCGSCDQRTNHEVVGQHTFSSDPDEYHYMEEHAVVKCMGCGRVSFRVAYHDYESAFPVGDDDWEVPISIETYPKVHRSEVDLRHLPGVVDRIYSETCAAYRDRAFTLAGIGFRATIEAICNDQGIAGKELSTRINNLASKGLISKKDSTRLHAIRFLGNDAAHDIKTPSESSLAAAQTIVDHLLTTVYVLDQTSKGGLEFVIEEYPNFEKLLLKKLEDFNAGDEFPIAKFLGKEMRLISGSSKQLEKMLGAEIGKGNFARLTFGVKATFQNSKEELQHYVVV